MARTAGNQSIAQQPSRQSSVIDSIGARIEDAFTAHPLSIAKGIGALALIAYMGLNPLSAAAIYGMYRFTNEQWVNTAKSWLASVYNFTTDLVSKVKNNQHTQNIFQRMYNLTVDFFTKKPTESQTAYNIKLGVAVGLGALIGVQLVLNSVSTLISLGLRVAQFAVVATGFSAVFQDIKYATGNPGNIFNTIGNSIQNGFQRCSASISNLWTRFAAPAENPAQPANALVVRNNDNASFFRRISKWGASFVAVATPILLISDGGLELIALAGGLGATGLIATSLALPVGGLIAATMAVKSLTGNHVSIEQPVVAALPHEPASAPKMDAPAAKALTPGFDKHKNKDAKKQPQTPSKAKAKAPVDAPAPAQDEKKRGGPSAK